MAQSENVDSPGADDPVSDAALGEGSADVGTALQGAAEVTDIVTLTAEVEQAYEGFDPSIHAMKDGQPIAKKGGGWQMKRGRKGGDAPGKMSGPMPGQVQGQPAPVAGPKISNEQVANILLHTIVTGSIAVLGDEWDVKEEAEFKTLKAGIKSYVESIGGLDMSPNWGLAFVLAGYAAPRLPKPGTQARLKAMWGWCLGFFKR